ncbi:hypothetical protein K6L44_10270 [Gluconacetobacter entanii]|uniref:Uncharacterized protein n=2 Tax=Acetobacteraceae TaxID=433 RepID=A0A2S3VZY8_9PROT|nr:MULTISPECIES: hypothetical protein [Acetobacteraceae]BCZ75962.1 hypothetical protein [Komagataeibacter phage phiKM1]MBY4640365.1 hypothetical protein [Gluconacetobacter entanii]MCW4581229.1 hypothetical protein [Gluconacetobacter entanii]MCW4582011.1 hypothetical protein [Gluconacetobacter entanii]MCW4584489.1 hypothetical protein [Gluconacetobacter entanii]
MKPSHRPRKPATDVTVWERAAAHYRRITQRDRRPGVKIWAAGRAQECAANMRAAQREAA